MNVDMFQERRTAARDKAVRDKAVTERVGTAQVRRVVAGAAGALVVGALLAGCAGVEPWERDVLARPDMQLVADPTEVAVDEHIYFSKEASSGGQGFGGGGCGCN